MRLRRFRFAPLLLAALALAAPPLRADEERFERTYDLTGISRVHLENVNGPVRVDTWDKPLFRLVAVKKATGGSAQDALRETEIRVSKVGSTIDVETRLPHRGRLFGFFFFDRRRGAEVSYELSLPAGTTIDVETVNGRVSAARRSAQTTLSTVNGSIRVEGQEGPLKVNTVNGSVEILFAGESRATDVETVNGSVEVTAGKGSSFRYELQTVNGAIRSDFGPLTVQGKFGPKSAAGEVNGGRERLAVETVNGEIHLRSAEAVAEK